jgi:hypothetical protein
VIKVRRHPTPAEEIDRSVRELISTSRPTSKQVYLHNLCTEAS